MAHYVLSDLLGNPVVSKSYDTLTEARVSAYRNMKDRSIILIEKVTEKRKTMQGWVKIVEKQNHAPWMAWIPYEARKTVRPFYELKKDGTLGEIVYSSRFY